MPRDYSEVESGTAVVELKDGGTRVLEDMRVKEGWVTGVPVECDDPRAVYEYFPRDSIKCVAEVFEE